MILSLSQDPAVSDSDKLAQLQTDLLVMGPKVIREICHTLGIDCKPLPRNKGYNIKQILKAPVEEAIAAYVSVKIIVAHRKALVLDGLKAVWQWVKDNLATLVGIRTWQDGVNILLGEVGHLLN